MLRSVLFLLCLAAAVGSSTEEKNNRAKLKEAALALYRNRANEKYTQDATQRLVDDDLSIARSARVLRRVVPYRRWAGIHNGVMPPKAPVHSDCSSAATWVYWTVFGKGKDFVNGPFVSLPQALGVMPF
jgi:hypothetical protein